MTVFTFMVNSLHAEEGKNPAPAEKVILAFGDSLTAGYGIRLDLAFPSQLERALRAKGYNVRVKNGGVSGETSTGGLERIGWTLQQGKPDFVILELGANDMLRATDPRLTRQNLSHILKKLKEAKTPVLLAGMKAFPNLGEKYAGAYAKIYAELAKEYDVRLYPFFLDGVALEAEFLQDDGLHPNAAGIAEIVKRITPAVEELLKSGS